MKTLINASREAIEERRTRVLEYVRLDEQVHNQMLFDYGNIFLTTTMRMSEDQAQEVATTKVYWNWFRLQWSTAQESYLTMRASFVKVSPMLEYNLYVQHMRASIVDSKTTKTSFENTFK